MVSIPIDKANNLLSTEESDGLSKKEKKKKKKDKKEKKEKKDKEHKRDHHSLSSSSSSDKKHKNKHKDKERERSREHKQDSKHANFSGIKLKIKTPLPPQTIPANQTQHNQAAIAPLKINLQKRSRPEDDAMLDETFPPPAKMSRALGTKKDVEETYFEAHN